MRQTVPVFLIAVRLPCRRSGLLFSLKLQLARIIVAHSCVLAEGVGFEPTEPLPALRFSRPVHSTTMRPFHYQMLQGWDIARLKPHCFLWYSFKRCKHLLNSVPRPPNPRYPLRARQFSRLFPSTTRTPFRNRGDYNSSKQLSKIF